MSMENTIYETLGLSENSANEKKTSSDYGQKFIENVLDCWDNRHVVMLNFQFDISKIVKFYCQLKFKKNIYTLLNYE